MMKKIIEKKWLLLSCVGILVVAIIAGIALASCDKDEGPKLPDGTGATEPTTEATDPTTEPTTEPTTDPHENDDPPPIEDETVPPDPTSPNGPETEPSESTESTEATEPTEDPGPGTDYVPDDGGNGSAEPQDPDPEVIPTAPPEYEPTEAPVDTTIDFGGVTPKTLTADIYYNQWDSETRKAFRARYAEEVNNSNDLDMKFNYNCIVYSKCDPYANGENGIWAYTEEGYNRVLAKMEEGCPHCGETRCEAWYRDEDSGCTTWDYTRCSEYDPKKDPQVYCQECGYIQLADGKEGDMCCHRWTTYGDYCPNCGEYHDAQVCHNCVKKKND